MKNLFYLKRNLLLTVFFLTAVLVFSQNWPLVNSQTFSMEDIDSLVISYQADSIIFLESSDSNLMFKEYLDQNIENAYSMVTQSGRTLTIEGSMGPRRSTGNAWVEIYLPPSYRGLFRLTASGGMIRSDINWESDRQIDITLIRGNLELRRVAAERINITISAGSIRAGRLAGKEIRVRNTSGSIDVNESSGTLDVESSSGPLAIRNMTGKGNFRIQSGNVDIGLREASGDLAFSVTSGSFNLALPRGLPFNLNAESRGGMIHVQAFGETSDVFAGNRTIRPFGPSPKITIAPQVVSGVITISDGM
jgi:hypothetical protein